MIVHGYEYYYMGFLKNTVPYCYRFNPSYHACVAT